MPVTLLVGVTTSLVEGSIPAFLQYSEQHDESVASMYVFFSFLQLKQLPCKTHGSKTPFFFTCFVLAIFRIYLRDAGSEVQREA